MKKLILKIADALNLYPFFAGFTKNTATVFMLHSIHQKDSSNGLITNDLLERYFDFLRRNNYKVLSLSDYIAAIIEKRNTYKSVVFTVDDGYRDFYLNAFPTFRKYDYPATIFLTSDFIEKRLFLWWDKIEFAFEQCRLTEVDLSFCGMGKEQLLDFSNRARLALTVTRYCKKLQNEEKLTLIDKLMQVMGIDISGQPMGKYEPLKWNEIDEMHKSKIDFHPHTITHPIITKIPRKQKVEELVEPKRIIEEHLGSKADIFCYPNGQQDDFDNETIEILKTSGYIAAVTGMEGFDFTIANPNLFALRRYPIPSDYTKFKQYVSGIEVFRTKLGI